MTSGDILYILAVFFIHGVQIFQESLQNPPVPRGLPHFGILQNMPQCKILSFLWRVQKSFSGPVPGASPWAAAPPAQQKTTLPCTTAGWFCFDATCGFVLQ